jgi:hypothetical protein
MLKKIHVGTMAALLAWFFNGYINDPLCAQIKYQLGELSNGSESELVEAQFDLTPESDSAPGYFAVTESATRTEATPVAQSFTDFSGYSVLDLHSPEEPLGDFPDQQPPAWAKLLEFGPKMITRPNDRFARWFGLLFRMEHDRVETELSDEVIENHFIPERPNLLLEWNERFLAPGFLNQGIETWSGAVWRPSVWVFGQYRTSVQYFDRNRVGDAVAENAHRLDLFGQLNLTGTERLLVQMRPLDEELGNSRNFSGYDFRNGSWVDGWNSKVQTLFFEGDFGELFPNLDLPDTRWLDVGFSVGRMPLLAQQGLLINEDMIDAATVTRNTLNGGGNLNLRVSGFLAWDKINRNSPTGLPNDLDFGSRMYGVLTESDFANSTVNVDGVFVDGDPVFGDMFAVGISSIQRHYLFENTYNTSLHALASFPDGPRTGYSDQGELLFAQTSWTPHYREDLIYVNSFWAIDQFTSPSRGPANGGPLGQTGILFSGIALGRYAAPIAVSTNNTAGASLGYQMFFDHTRSQVILEFGGLKETKGVSQGALGTGVRFQKACGQHTIFVLDTFVTKQETQPVATGGRFEVLLKF